MAQEITIDVRGLRELKGALRDYPKIALPLAHKAMRDVGGIFQRHAALTTTAQLPQKSGKLKESLHYAYGQTWGLFYSDPRIAPYARFVHEGTKPHVILPRIKRALAFAWVKRGYATSRSGRRYYKKVDFGNVVFRLVRHPGTKPRPFMAEIAEKSKPEITMRFRSTLDQITSTIARHVNTAQ